MTHPQDELGLTQDTMRISYAQNCEDVRLWRVLDDVLHGHYVEVGGWDPVEHSISRSFYLRDWNGVVLEPVAENAQRYQQVRPRDQVVCCLAGATAGMTDFHVVPGTGLSTAAADIAARHGSTGFPIEVRPTPVRTLNDVLAECSLPAIHFMSIDVEGAESEVLAGLDLQVHRPWILLIEATAPGTANQTDHAWEEQVLAAGYQFATFDGLNRYYVAAEHADLAPRLALSPNVFDRYRVAEWAVAELQRRQALAESEQIRLQAHRQWLVATEREQTLNAIVQAGREALASSQAQVAAASHLAAERQEWIRDRDRLTAEIRALQATAQAEHTALEQLMQSRSWRITRPLRRGH